MLPPETVVPPFTVFSGCPGKLEGAGCWGGGGGDGGRRAGELLMFLSSPGLFSGELPECTQELMIDVTKSYYQKFLPLTQI